PSTPWSTLLFDIINKKEQAAMSNPKPVIKNVDMAEEMQTEAVQCAITAFDLYSVEKDIAAYLKKEFDKKKISAGISLEPDVVINRKNFNGQHHMIVIGGK
ncbi:Dynein light chain 1, cytoplasmic, partial [Modicella reniformis]